LATRRCGSSAPSTSRPLRRRAVPPRRPGFGAERAGPPEPGKHRGPEEVKPGRLWSEPEADLVDGQARGQCLDLRSLAGPEFPSAPGAVRPGTRALCCWLPRGRDNRRGCTGAGRPRRSTSAPRWRRGGGSGDHGRDAVRRDRLARVPIERDPDRVRELAEEKRDENASLRVFLKRGSLSPRLVDRLFHRLFVEVAAEIDCTECAACCMQLGPLLDTSNGSSAGCVFPARSSRLRICTGSKTVSCSTGFRVPSSTGSDARAPSSSGCSSGSRRSFRIGASTGASTARRLPGKAPAAGASVGAAEEGPTGCFGVADRGPSATRPRHAGASGAGSHRAC